MSEEVGVKDKFKKQTTGYLMAALGFVVGLAWDDAIKSLIEFLFPLSGSEIWIKFIYAIGVTILVFVVGNYVLKAE